jgi:arylsulfatase A-like enzyme
MNMGHHGICCKGNGTRPVNLFDTSCKVPAILNRPGHLPAGRVAQELYAHYDWRPTLLDYVGVGDPEAADLPGQSFARMLRGGEESAGRPVVVFDEYGPVRMIRTREWKYVHRYNEERPHELYDLENDPGETRNVADRPENRERIDQMRRELQEWFDRYSVPQRDGSCLPVTGCGQTRPAEEPDAFCQNWPDAWLNKN